LRGLSKVKKNPKKKNNKDKTKTSFFFFLSDGPGTTAHCTIIIKL
jgi:hypothetical protein